MSEQLDEHRQDNDTAETPNRSLTKFFVLLGIIIVVVIGCWGYFYYRSIYPSTDDAYVNAHAIHIAAEVSGKVDQVYVENNQYVKKGTLLFRIDPQAFQYKLENAQAKLQVAKAQVISDEKLIHVDIANVEKAQAQAWVAKMKANRIVELVKSGDASKEEGDEVVGSLKEANAQVRASQAQLAQAQSALDVAKTQVLSAKAEVDTAKLNLSYTKITAPADGYVTDFDAIRHGSMINEGQNLFVLVADKTWWIDANYKETDMQHIKPGQKATVEIDMYPGVKLKGIVQSISYGSGTVFSLLPPENATGNWVKVTQRFPVKVLLDEPIENHLALRVGASADVVVDTNS
ncbi:HlyD family secretion protein [Thiotrichales bacterium 19S3-7]|nr:HlyD family secretion protein [Thiotrichales bacterium 19S3-7]MCF6800772.1 HlyD family secretion protein [Thiotrichales bacterium 19S3-11]